MIENYIELANAIIVLAAKDYKFTIRFLAKNPNHAKALQEKKDIEEFFLSEYFYTLTSIDGKKLIKKLQEKYL